MTRALEARIPPPVVALACAVLIWWIAEFLPKLELGFVPRVTIAGALLAAGAFFDLSGILTFRRAMTTVNPMTPSSTSALVDTGVYRITRNPMYVGLVFILSGWCVFLSSPVALIVVAGFASYVHRFQILPEERALIALFGDEYTRYQSTVRRWL